MDPGTGKIYDVVDDVALQKKMALIDKLLTTRRQISASEARERGYVPVTRDLTAKENMEQQIRLYSPCACGSGKKFKFCCKR